MFCSNVHLTSPEKPNSRNVRMALRLCIWAAFSLDHAKLPKLPRHPQWPSMIQQCREEIPEGASKFCHQNGVAGLWWLICDIPTPRPIDLSFCSEIRLSPDLMVLTFLRQNPTKLPVDVSFFTGSDCALYWWRLQYVQTLKLPRSWWSRGNSTCIDSVRFRELWTARNDRRSIGCCMYIAPLMRGRGETKLIKWSGSTRCVLMNFDQLWSSCEYTYSYIPSQWGQLQLHIQGKAPRAICLPYNDAVYLVPRGAWENTLETEFCLHNATISMKISFTYIMYWLLYYIYTHVSMYMHTLEVGDHFFEI